MVLFAVCLYIGSITFNSASLLQVECLNVDGVLQRRNLVYCASTRYCNLALTFSF